MPPDEKTYTDRLRRMAKRQGLRLVKNSRRDPRATDFGHVVLIDDDKNIVAQFDNLAEVEKSLLGE